MKITHLWQRARSAWQRIAGTAAGTGAQDAAPSVALDAVKERFAQLQLPTMPAVPGLRLHMLIKLGPIPLPRAVRWEGHGMYALAWAGTALLAWGAWQIPVEWLLEYGLVAVVVFAVLFRLEGPRTRHERRMRQAQVELCRSHYLEAEQHLQTILQTRFAERMQDFQALQHLHEAASQAIAAVEGANASALYVHDGMNTWEQQLAAEVEDLEAQMLALVHELEAFSSVHKKEIDHAITARHDARLAYWQARLDASLFTGEMVYPVPEAPADKKI